MEPEVNFQLSASTIPSPISEHSPILQDNSCPVKSFTVVTLGKQDLQALSQNPASFGCTKVLLSQRKCSITEEDLALIHSGETVPKIPKITMPGDQVNNQLKSKPKKKKKKKPKNNVSQETDSEYSESDSSPPETPQNVLLDFETEVRLGLQSINAALRGDDKTVGLVTHVKDIEADLYGGDKLEKGLQHRVENLEKKANKRIPSATSSSSLQFENSGELSASLIDLQDQVTKLEQCNKTLIGITDRLQRKNKSLQNQLYVQKDHQNYLNLHLGGVHECKGKTVKEEVVSFFNEILKMADVKITDIVKAYRISSTKEYEDVIADEAGSSVTLGVTAPGVTFVRLQSEYIREQAMLKARGLGGRRHQTLNHKYFVAPVECEATKATKSKNKQKSGT